MIAEVALKLALGSAPVAKTPEDLVRRSEVDIGENLRPGRDDRRRLRFGGMAAERKMRHTGEQQQTANHCSGTSISVQSRSTGVAMMLNGSEHVHLDVAGIKK